MAISLEILNKYANGETPVTETPVSETPATPEKPKRERKSKQKPAPATPVSEPATEQTVTLTQSALEALVAQAVKQALESAMASQQVVATPTTPTTTVTPTTQTTPDVVATPEAVKIPLDVKHVLKAQSDGQIYWVNHAQGNKYWHNRTTNVTWNLVKLDKGSWIAKAVHVVDNAVVERTDVASVAFKYIAELEKTWAVKVCKPAE